VRVDGEVYELDQSHSWLSIVGWQAPKSPQKKEPFDYGRADPPDLSGDIALKPGELRIEILRSRGCGRV